MIGALRLTRRTVNMPEEVLSRQNLDAGYVCSYIKCIKYIKYVYTFLSHYVASFEVKCPGIFLVALWYANVLMPLKSKCARLIQL